MRQGGKQANNTFGLESSGEKEERQTKSYESTGQNRFLPIGKWGWLHGEGALRLGLEEEMRMIIVIMIIISVQHY